MAAESTTIYAGMGVCEINPRKGLPLAGFPSRRANTGVGPMPLCARALVVGESAETPQAVILVLDNLGVSFDIVARIRQSVVDAIAGLKIDSVMVCATHTHSAPALRQYGEMGKGKSPSVDPEYIEQIVSASASASKAAWSVSRQVRATLGCGSAQLHHNRRVVGDDGKAVNEWLDPDGTHKGVTNPEIPFVAFRDAGTDELVWLLGSYACHPVTMGPPNVEASPDYPGGFVKAAKDVLGAREAMFITGAGADINPIDALGGDHNASLRMGAALVDEVAAKMDSGVDINAAPIRAHIEPLSLEVGPEARANYSNRAADAGDAKNLHTEVQAVRIGDLAVVSAPGELFTEIGQAIEKVSVSPRTLVASFTNDYLGYLFTDKALAEGGYESKNAISLNIEKPLVEAARKATVAVMK